MNVYIGIDPGASGGLAALSDYVAVPTITAMPATERDILEWVAHYSPDNLFDSGESLASLSTSGTVSACIEQVGGYIGGGPPCPVCHQSRNRSPGSSMFKFGEGYGGLCMALTAANIPFEKITPQKWQKAMGIPAKKKSMSKNAHKNVIKQRAQEIFPGLKITLATCDALLIALYCKRKAEGTL